MLFVCSSEKEIQYHYSNKYHFKIQKKVRLQSTQYILRCLHTQTHTRITTTFNT